MRRYVTIAQGLALGVVVITMGQQAQAQGRARYAFPYDRVAMANGSQEEMLPTPENWVEGSSVEGTEVYEAGPGMPQGPCGCDQGYPGGGPCGCEEAYGAPCGDAYGYGCSDGYCGWPATDPMFGGLWGTPCWGRLSFGADYLYVRSNFSQATAYIVQDVTQLPGQIVGSDEFHDLDFRHESSYRLHGAYELGNCGEALRFMFTRFNSYADTAIPFGDDILVPYSVDPPPGGQTLAHADVDFKVYDVDLAKTIPLGGTAICNGSCGCGDACGGDCGCGGCAPCCPTWDITWSGGLRFADTDWRRSFAAVDEAGALTGNEASTVMNFEGGGVRVGLEGRRYLGCSGIFSMFMRGDLSLLLGNTDIRTEVTDPDADAFNVQTLHTRNVIPVTDIEGGLTVQLSCYTRLSAGYLFSAWHDLGMRDQSACSETLLEVGYDDANILAFDGMFARLEADF